MSPGSRTAAVDADVVVTILDELDVGADEWMQRLQDRRERTSVVNGSPSDVMRSILMTPGLLSSQAPSLDRLAISITVPRMRATS
jgi:hypothetical protein